MKFIATLALVFSVLGLSAQTPPKESATLPKENAPLSYVDPYIGTGGHGHVFLGASVPYGAVQVGPTNFNKGWDWCSGYHYSDSVVKGFSQDHLNGTGIPDLCDIDVMPFTGPVRTEPGTQTDPASGYSSHYDHRQEIARPAYYYVWLKDHHIGVQLTASERVAFHRYSFPAGRPGHIIIDLFQGNFDTGWQHPKVVGCIQELDDSTLIGWRNSSQWAQNRRIYFAIRTNIPMKDLTLLDGDRPVKARELQADTVKALISLPAATRTVMLKIGLSNVSGENALANIVAEIPGWDFAAVVREGDKKWERQLQKIAIEPADPEQQKVFYTALYHTMIAPALYNDHDSSYRGTDGKVVEHAPFNNYTIFSLWDTYRTFHPLMTLIQPERVNDFVNSMLAIYQQQGKLPIWHLQGRETDCMVGYSAVPVIADAWLNGFHGFDPNLALAAMKASSTRNDYGMEYLKKEGFIPADKEEEAISKAMEYAIDDWCISRMAAGMGHTGDAATYARRSGLFARYFDPATRFMRPVLSDGSFITPFNPFLPKNYTEGNAWQYTWLVPQDPEKLITLMGGDKPFVTKLDSLFVVTGSLGSDAPPDISGLVGMYAQGNEPVHHIPYLYAFAGAQWKSAGKVAHIARELYTAGVDGLCGNDDAGQMSAWYVMSALGFYPVNPCNGIFVFGTPLMRKAVVNVGGSHPFTMETVGFSKNNVYIQRATLNGAPYTKSYIDFQQIKAGSTLCFYMGDRPNRLFGAAKSDRPVSTPPLPSPAGASAQTIGQVDPEHIHDRPTLAIGARAPDFRLPGVDGKTYTLSSFSNARVLVVVFMCNHCPTSQAYEQRIIRLTRDYAGKGVSVVAINPNAPGSLRLDELGYSDVGDGFDDMKTRARQVGYNFPYLYDGATEIASRQYGPVSTPHLFIFDRQRRLRYDGRFDDTEDPSKTPHSNDARNAIDALLADREPPVTVTKTFGCSIKWIEKRNWTQKAAIAWAREPVRLDTIGLDGIGRLVHNDTKKLRLINLWATWCIPCVEEYPELVTLHRMYRDRGFELVSISTDASSARGKALHFLEKQESSSPNYIFTGEDKYRLIEAIDPQWQGALPYSLLVEPGGKIVYAHQGAIDAGRLRKIIFDDPYMGRIYK